MGLVNCFDCGTPISVNATTCPNCGTIDTPMARRLVAEDEKKWEAIRKKQEEDALLVSYGFGFLLLLVLILIIWTVITT